MAANHSPDNSAATEEKPVPEGKLVAVREAIAAVFYGSVNEISLAAIRAASAWDAANRAPEGHQ